MTTSTSIINPTNEFHLLRHFSSVDNSYKKTLENKPYWYYDYPQQTFLESTIATDEIEHALSTLGTKFSSNISGIENPNKLLCLIYTKILEAERNNQLSWIQGEKRDTASFVIDYPSEVGMMNAFPKKSLNPVALERVKNVPRSKCQGENEEMVDTISGIELRPTNMIYVEVVKMDQLPFYAITAFPDCSANNLSDDEIVFVI